MSDRIFALALLAVAGGYAAMALALQVPFQYEPLGPKPWPILLAIVIAICAAIVLVRPDREPHWPMGQTLRKVGALLLGLLLYAALFEPLGFMVTTTIACVVFALMLGARRAPALVFGLAMGIPGYFVWTSLLQLNLPLGGIFH